MLKDGIIVVTRITRPTRKEGKHRRSDVSDTVRIAATYVVDRTRPHEFKPCPPLLVHEDQSAFASGCNVILGTISQDMKVALRHKVFVAHQTWLHEGSSPKQAANHAFRNWPEHLYTADKLGGAHDAPCFVIAKYAFELSEGPADFLDALAGQLAGGEVNSDGFAHHENSSPVFFQARRA